MSVNIQLDNKSLLIQEDQEERDSDKLIREAKHDIFVSDHDSKGVEYRYESCDEERKSLRIEEEVPIDVNH